MKDNNQPPASPYIIIPILALNDWRTLSADNMIILPLICQNAWDIPTWILPTGSTPRLQLNFQNSWKRKPIPQKEKIRHRAQNGHTIPSSVFCNLPENKIREASTSRIIYGAVERTWTSTKLPPLEPESSKRVPSPSLYTHQLPLYWDSYSSHLSPILLIILHFIKTFALNLHSALLD